MRVVSPRIVVVLLGAGLLCLATWLAAAGARTQSLSALDEALSVSSAETASVVEEYFERARALDLLLAQSPAFRSPGPGQPLDRRAMNKALLYLEALYPKRIGEACVIDRRGHEVARVVQQQPAEPADLSTEEAAAVFFAPTFASAQGEVYQSQPYRSPDTEEWVISNATQIPWIGPSPLFVHFEVTVASFQEQIATMRSEHARILDATGRVIVDSRRPQRAAADLGWAADESTRAVLDSRSSAGVLTVDDLRLSYRRIDAGPTNANDWYVVTDAPVAAGLLATQAGQAAAAAGIGALLLLGAALYGARAQQRRLRHLAHTDSLTGLPNRLMFRLTLDERLRSGGRHALLLLDLDGFKDVNDTLGHLQGDVVLAQVAERLLGALAPEDHVARLGGDEFAVVLSPTDADLHTQVAVTAKRLLACLRQPMVVDGIGLRVDASIGVALAPEHGRTAPELLQHADVAMYQAKSAGVGHQIYCPDANPHTGRRLELISGLLGAIENKQLAVAYQPKVRLSDRATVGVEALVRWDHPTLGLLSPAEFVPLAEDIGLIRSLTLCVLDQTLSQCSSWLAAGLRLPVSVNCSMLDVADRRFPGEVADLLAATGCPASLLTLEITESMVLSEPERVTEVIEILSAMGVRLSIDDFGTGYSSLTQLRRLPVHELKIDRSFVGSAAVDSRDAYIVRSTLELGQNLGLDCVAEGVEDDATLALLESLGCEVAQGYLFSPPLAPAALNAWLARQALGAGLKPFAGG